MEPLSIIASFIAVFQAGEKTLKLLSRAQQASHAVQDLEELNFNVGAVQNVLAKSRCMRCRQANCEFCVTILACDTVLGKLEQLVKECTRDPSSLQGPFKSQVIKARWLRRRTKIESLKVQLRDILILLTVQITINSPHCPAQKTNSAKDAAVGFDDLVNETLLLHGQPTERSKATLLEKYPASNPTKPLEILRIATGGKTDAVRHADIHSITYRRAIQWRVSIFQGRLGLLLVRLTGFLPGHDLNLNQQTSGKGWQFKAIKCTLLYVLPRWLSQLALYVTIANSARPQFGLSVMRVQDPGSEFCISIRQGDYRRVCELLANGRGHVSDMISPYGLSPLQLAVQCGQLKIYRLLAAHGAQLLPANSHWQPSDLWDYMNEWSRNPCSLPFSEIFQDIVGFSAPDERMLKLSLTEEVLMLSGNEFTRLQKCVIGLSHENLEDLCRNVRLEVNETDDVNRTALHWAVKVNSPNAVNHLLRCGADPEIPDLYGYTPMHIAAAMGSESCLRILISSGADLEARDRLRQTPLMYACYQGQLEVIALLLDLGANIETIDCLGESCLSLANLGKRVDVVNLLIDRGASLKNHDAWGYIPLFDSILTNFHEALVLYLPTSARETATKLADGGTILHLVARNADGLTMKMLLDADLVEVDSQAIDLAGNTPMDYFLRRTDRAELSTSFAALLAKAGKLRDFGRTWDNSNMQSKMKEDMQRDVYSFVGQTPCSPASSKTFLIKCFSKPISSNDALTFIVAAILCAWMLVHQRWIDVMSSVLSSLLERIYI